MLNVGFSKDIIPRLAEVTAIPAVMKTIMHFSDGCIEHENVAFQNSPALDNLCSLLEIKSGK